MLEQSCLGFHFSVDASSMKQSLPGNDGGIQATLKELQFKTTHLRLLNDFKLG